MKNGLYHEDGDLIYYKNGHRKHAGVIRVDGDIYYISSGGRAVSGTHIVHRDMTNDIIKHGTYEFGEDCKLIPGSYAAPERKETKLHAFLRKRRHFISAAISVLVVLDLMMTVRYIDRRERITLKEKEKETETVSEVPAEVVLCSNAAKEFCDGKLSVPAAIKGGMPYRGYELKTETNGKGGTLYLSETPAFEAKTEYVIDADRDSVMLNNLKTGLTYYYKTVTDGKEKSGSFTTAESVRFVSLPGVKNTRDIGGQVTSDGKTVRQGMLIRGSEIDGLVDPTCFLERDYVQQAQKEFGFVCDTDLRGTSLFGEKYQSRLGSNVKHLCYRDLVDARLFSPEFNRALRAVFADLAKPENYPMYLHCTDGAGRTGTVCYLLEGVLNLPEEVMERDYQLSGFAYADYAGSEAYNTINGGVEGYRGATVQEKITDYLITTVGVTEDEIRSIRNILLK